MHLAIEIESVFGCHLVETGPGEKMKKYFTSLELVTLWSPPLFFFG